MSESGGWVKIYRCLIEKAIWNDSTVEQKVVLLTLIMMANHREKQWLWKSQKFEAAPGQFITSLNSIKQKAGKGISIRNVRTALDKFKMLDFLTDEPTKTGRLITLINWGKYQSTEEGTDKATDKEPTKRRQRTDKAPAPNKNERIEEGKNVKNKDKINYADYVSMTQEEHEKLIAKFGEKATDRMIELLDNYKGATGKKYKEDYRAILNWVVKRLEEEGQGSGGVPKAWPGLKDWLDKKENGRVPNE